MEVGGRITVLSWDGSDLNGNLCSYVLTLSKGLQHVASHPCQAVLRRVSRGGPSRGGAYGHGHGAARAVTGGRMRGASGLGLQQKNIRDRRRRRFQL